MKKIGIFLILIVIIIAGAFIWFQNGLSPVNQSDTSTKSFIIPRGQPLREISNDLKEAGLIRDPVVFFLMIKQEGLDQKIQAGNFKLSPSMSAQEIAENLTKGVLDVWVTIPEGKRAEEVADILEESIPSYEDSWREQLISREGYLFPDTYLIPRDATIDQIITVMTDNFNTKYSALEGPRKNQYTMAELVTIASMVEREAKHNEDRPLVSSVMFNRLEEGTGLYIDATVQYAIGNESNWWPVLNDSPRNIAPQSPYNTYNFAGLPPTPISNPGLAVLEAVVNAPDTNYLYYITDQSGINRYSETLEGHNQNIQEYGL